MADVCTWWVDHLTCQHLGRWFVEFHRLAWAPFSLPPLRPLTFQLLICPSARYSRAISVATIAVITTQRPYHGHVYHAHHHHHAVD